MRKASTPITAAAITPIITEPVASDGGGLKGGGGVRTETQSTVFIG